MILNNTLGSFPLPHGSRWKRFFSQPLWAQICSITSRLESVGSPACVWLPQRCSSALPCPGLPGRPLYVLCSCKNLNSFFFLSWMPFHWFFVVVVVVNKTENYYCILKDPAWSSSIFICDVTFSVESHRGERSSHGSIPESKQEPCENSALRSGPPQVLSPLHSAALPPGSPLLGVSNQVRSAPEKRD